MCMGFPSIPNIALFHHCIPSFTVQVLVTGQTGGCEDLFLKKVSDRLPEKNLKPERYREDSGHFLLVFCPVVSRVGTDMQNALEHLQGESKSVLVMLHHKPKEYDRFLDTTLQAQHPAVVRTVHARYTLEDGLYGCQVNKEAVAAVAEILKVHRKKMTKEPSDPAVKRSLLAQLVLPKSSQRRGNPPNSERQWPKQKPPADGRGQRLEDWEPRKKRNWYSRPRKDFPIQVLVTGQIGDCGNEFLQRVSDRLPKIKLKRKRYRGDSSHFLVVFCPVVSRVGTDMQNALEHLQGEPKAILVMLHHKPKEYDHFLDTTLQVQHPAVVLTVHIRYTLEDGLYGCQVNKEAVAAVAEILKVHRKKVRKPCHSWPIVLNLGSAVLWMCYYLQKSHYEITLPFLVKDRDYFVGSKLQAQHLAIAHPVHVGNTLQDGVIQTSGVKEL
nr:uncharacterized protein LOC132779494 [Anolis sagrei ordinatus]